MQRWTVLLFVGLVGLAATIAVLGGRRVPEQAAGAPSVVAPSPTGPMPAAVTASAAAPGAGEPRAPLPLEDATDAGGTLPNGDPAPPLAADAPRQVVFGVVLVTYRGAQGATSNARSREGAEQLAAKVAAEAKRDFSAAVKLGDVGFDNAGVMQRGILEPGPEHVLFGLAVGEVGPPVDSPRGFYVFKRIE